MVSFTAPMALIAYLLFISSVFSIVIEGKEMEQIDNLADRFAIPEVETRTQIDFTDEGLNLSGLIEKAEWSLGNWKYAPPVGLIAEPFSSALLVNDIIADEGYPHNFTVTYYINNSVHADFSLFPRYTKTMIIHSWDTVEICFDNDLIYIPNQALPIFHDYDYPYPEITSKDTLKVTTIMHEKTRAQNYLGEAIDYAYVKVYVNDVYLFTSNELPALTTFSYPYYAGVDSPTADFTITKIDANIKVGQTDTQAGFWEEYFGFTAKIGEFIKTMLTLLVWNVDEKYLPWELNVLFIKLPVFALIGTAVLIARGD